MGRLTNKQLGKFLKEFDSIVEIYKQKYTKETKVDWRTYEDRLAHRIKTVAREINNVIDKADRMIVKTKSRGPKPKIPAKKKVLILLLKEIFQMSNRRMANLMLFFTLLTGVDTSYKTIERSYSYPLVRIIIHNMFIIMVKKKGIKQADLTGDGTGYTLMIKRYYTGKRKENKEKKKFAYAFALMDLDTKMYVGYGVSLKSEKDAFNKAMGMLEETEVIVRSVRLDKYYSHQSIVHEFSKDTKIYILLKKNATIKGSPGWKKIVKDIMEHTLVFLGEYYQRNNSESGYSADKRMFGWRISQKRDDRIETAVMCNGVWHNLMWLG